MATKEYSETVRFRHWISDTACFEGEAKVTTYSGTHSIDEFGYYDNDDYSADIDILYYCEEGEQPKEAYPYAANFDHTLRRDLENAAIEAGEMPPALPVVFPGESLHEDEFYGKV